MTKSEALASVTGMSRGGRKTDKDEVRKVWNCRHRTGCMVALTKANVAMASSYRHAYAGFNGTCEEPEPFLLHHKTADGEDWVGNFLAGIGTHYLVPVKDVRPATDDEIKRFTAGAYRLAGTAAWQLSIYDFWKEEEEGR